MSSRFVGLPYCFWDLFDHPRVFPYPHFRLRSTTRFRALCPFCLANGHRTSPSDHMHAPTLSPPPSSPARSILVYNPLAWLRPWTSNNSPLVPCFRLRVPPLQVTLLRPIRPLLPLRLRLPGIAEKNGTPDLPRTHSQTRGLPALCYATILERPCCVGLGLQIDAKTVFNDSFPPTTRQDKSCGDVVTFQLRFRGIC
jgi:hypothetical protein